jgi:hypothetical protein
MAIKQKERPGVMLYFDDVRPVISRLDEIQCGVLLRSVMDYAQYGVVPELDPMTGLAFDMLVPKIDRDAERYEESREQRLYATYSREKKKKGEPPLSYEEWRLMQNAVEQEGNDPSRPVHENNGPLHPVNEIAVSYPSTSASPAATTTPTVTVSTTAATSAATSANTSAAGERGGCKGEAQTLYEAWLKAMEAKDNKSALNLSDRLFALGYHADIATRELRKRPALPRYP